MKKITLVAAVLLFVSCEKKIEDRYIVNDSTSLKINTKDLEIIHSDLVSADSVFSQLKNTKNNTKSIELLTEEEKDVVIKDYVQKVFDPEVCPCKLPEKIFKKLKKAKDQGKNWAPAEVIAFLNKLPVTAKHLEATSVNALLHYVKIKSTDGTVRTWPLIASPTFEKFDYEKYILGKSNDSFIYTLDCSGYLNVAIEASAEVPGADIKTVAGAAVNNQKSMFVGGGTLISPINSAYYGGAFGEGYTKQERIAVLNALLSIPDIVDSDQFIISNSYQVVWISIDGKSSFNGQATLGGGGNASFGIASVKSSSESGGKISRTSTFTSYDTYLTGKKEIPDLRPFTVQAVRNLKDQLSRETTLP